MLNKRIKDKSLTKNYSKLDNRIFSKKMSSGAVLLYCFFSTMSEEFHPAISHITEVLGFSRPTVIKLIKELINRNIIVCVKKGGPGRITKYGWVSPREWK